MMKKKIISMLILSWGCYPWRLDQVLKAVVDIVALAINTGRKQLRSVSNIAFVKAGEKPFSQPRLTTGLLASTSDWQLRIDLGKQLKFPDHITSTTLHPDIVTFSDTTRQLIMVELTVPWEESMEEAYERKHAKYQELVEQCKNQGWNTCCEPIVVGCQGFAGHLLCKGLTQLGIVGLRKGGP